MCRGTHLGEQYVPQKHTGSTLKHTGSTMKHRQYHETHGQYVETRGQYHETHGHPGWVEVHAERPTGGT